MKRIVAFLAAVCVSTGVCLATSAGAQDAPPPPPTDASGDTLKTKAPAKDQTTEAEDTTAAAAARARRARAIDSRMTYVLSFGLGSAIDYNPDEFKDNYSPMLGGTLAFGVQQYGVVVAANIGYNFFLVKGIVPNDLNILTIMLDVRYTAPIYTRARPYLLVCGGYWKQWVVDLDYSEGVLGYGGGAGVEMEIDRVKRLFLDVRYIQGRTREIERGINVDASNTEIIPIRLGLTWEFR